MPGHEELDRQRRSSEGGVCPDDAASSPSRRRSFSTPVGAASAGRDAGPTCGAVRTGLLIAGWANVGAGLVGLFVPLMPTTIFLLIALWCFSRSSLRFHRWLYHHPTLGRTLRAWHREGVIPLRAKVAAVAVMTASWLATTIFLAKTWWLPAVMLAVFAAMAAFILSRPHRSRLGEPVGE